MLNRIQEGTQPIRVNAPRPNIATTRHGISGSDFRLLVSMPVTTIIPVIITNAQNIFEERRFPTSIVAWFGVDGVDPGGAVAAQSLKSTILLSSMNPFEFSNRISYIPKLTRGIL